MVYIQTKGEKSLVSDNMERKINDPRIYAKDKNIYIG